jgi:hypothetical protein
MANVLYVCHVEARKSGSIGAFASLIHKFYAPPGLKYGQRVGYMIRSLQEKGVETAGVYFIRTAEDSIPMYKITWHLAGNRMIVAKDTSVQNAFDKLTNKNRADITMLCISIDMVQLDIDMR